MTGNLFSCEVYENSNTAVNSFSVKPGGAALMVKENILYTLGINEGGTKGQAAVQEEYQ